MGRNKTILGGAVALVCCVALMRAAVAGFTIEADVMPVEKKVIAQKIEVKEIDVSRPQGGAVQPVTPSSPSPGLAPVALPSPPSEPPKPMCQWEVFPKQSYEMALNAWAKCAGWAGIDWQGKEMAPSFHAAFAPSGSFVDALRELKRASGLDITVYEDNKIVLVVIPR